MEWSDYGPARLQDYIEYVIQCFDKMPNQYDVFEHVLASLQVLVRVEILSKELVVLNVS